MGMQLNEKSRKKVIALRIFLLFLAVAMVALLSWQIRLISKANNQITQLESKIEKIEESTISDEERQALKKAKEELSELKEEHSKIVEENHSLRQMKLPRRDQKIVYLTFDDGPSDNTLKILDILDKYKVKATFFVIGDSKTQYMKEIVNRGHAIGLHTYSHKYDEIYASKEAYFNDLKKISDLVKSKTGVESKIIRFPGGGSNTVSKKYSKGLMSTITKEVASKGYAYFDWNASNGDADANNLPVEKQLKFIESQTKGRKGQLMVLMHDTMAKSTTVDALPGMIEFYQNNGYKFGKITTDTPPEHHKVLN